MAVVLKTTEPETVPGVRIPLSLRQIFKKIIDSAAGAGQVNADDFVIVRFLSVPILHSRSRHLLQRFNDRFFRLLLQVRDESTPALRSLSLRMLYRSKTDRVLWPVSCIGAGSGVPLRIKLRAAVRRSRAAVCPAVQRACMLPPRPSANRSSLRRLDGRPSGSPVVSQTLVVAAPPSKAARLARVFLS